MPGKYLDRLRGSDEHLRAARMTVDRQLRSQSGERRSEVRHSYNPPAPVRLRVEHAGGTVGLFTVHAHNISNAAIGFFNGAFVYPQSSCEVDLVTHDGERILVSASIVRCVCVEGPVHYAVALFDESIDAEMILGQGEHAESMPTIPESIENETDLVRILTENIADISQSPALWQDALPWAEEVKRLITGHATRMKTEHHLADAHIALVDMDGVIKMVNHAWCRFAIDNDYASKPFTGTNYLDQCKTLFQDGLVTADLFENIKSAITGETESYTYCNTCHSTRQNRWFMNTITKIEGNDELKEIRYSLIARTPTENTPSP